MLKAMSVASLTTCLASPLALAAEATISLAEAGQPRAVIEDIVENGDVNEAGVRQPSTGVAHPRENWFGCGPDAAGKSCDVDSADRIDGGKPDRVETPDTSVHHDPE